MAGSLHGAAGPPAEPLDAKQVADLAHNDARAHALGTLGATALAAYEAGLPDDGGEARVTRQPSDVRRFDAAFLRWNGGDNFTDNPNVRVQRSTGRGWTDFAGQAGEVVTTVRYPGADAAPAYLSGGHEWIWTATFEAFVARFPLGDRPQATPTGTYRFVVEGERRRGGRRIPYRLVSDTFQVRVWNGVTAENLRAEPNGNVSFRVGPRRVLTVSEGGPPVAAEIGPIDYPDSYADPARPRFVRERRTAYRDPAAPGDPAKLEWFCFTCSFRPWADTGDASRAVVTIVRSGGRLERAPARALNGRWVTSARLGPGDSAVVGAGCVRDRWGDRNGSSSAVLGPPVAAGVVGRAACA
jgi:hypothetical protein